MKKSILLLNFVIFLITCSSEKKSEHSVEYKAGDFWVAGFRNNDFPSKAFYQDKVYCSSIEISSGKLNYLYSLDLKTGIVDWATQVDQWASQPPIVRDSFIYYCSYVGDIYKFNKKGIQQWKAKLAGSYAGHAINPVNNNLFVSSVENGVFEFDFADGVLVNQYGGHALGATLPVFYQDLMCMGTGLKFNRSGEPLGDSLSCINTSNHRKVWSIETKDIMNRLFAEAGKVYFFDERAVLNCINIFDGKLLWRSDSLPKHNISLGSPHIVFEDTSLIVYGSDLNKMVSLNKETGKVTEETSYVNLRSGKRMPASVAHYTIRKSKVKYTVFVSDSLQNSEAYKEEYSIQILEGI